MLNWFAPALVALPAFSAVEAMKLSFLSCLHQWLPFLVCGLIGVAITIRAAVAIAIAAALAFMSESHRGQPRGAAMMAMIALVVGPRDVRRPTPATDTLAVDDHALVQPGVSLNSVHTIRADLRAG